MLLLAHDLEPCLLVDVSRRMKIALRPQRHLLVSRLPRKSNAFLNKALADSQPARLRFNMQQAQLRDVVGHLSDKGATDSLSILFRDPAAFPIRIIILDELRHDLPCQRLVGSIPSILFGIKNCLAMHDPAQVARLMLSQQIGSTCRHFIAKQSANRLHRIHELLPLVGESPSRMATTSRLERASNGAKALRPLAVRERNFCRSSVLDCSRRMSFRRSNSLRIRLIYPASRPSSLRMSVAVACSRCASSYSTRASARAKGLLAIPSTTPILRV